MSAITLPPDVLLLICAALGEVHQASVPAFALVCREWARVSTIDLYRSISFTITGKSHLKQDVDDGSASLQRTGCLRHVHRLEIYGPGPYTDPSSVTCPSPGWRRAPYQDFGERLYDIAPHCQPWNRTITVSRLEDVPDASWQPLAHLINQLPALTDIFWNCPQQIPSCVLDTLHEHLPRSRLWANTFRFRNLHKPELEARELKLMTSPCLHAVRVDFLTAWSSADGTKAIHAHDDDALLRLVSGMAPNLKKVLIAPRPPFSMPFSNPKTPWEGFNTNEPLPSVAQGELRALCFKDRPTSSEEMDLWSAGTDFAVLQSLEVPQYCGEFAFDKLRSLPFRDLRELAISIGRQVQTSDQLIEAAQRFLISVPLLETLLLEGLVHRLRMDSILEHHGSRLRRLWLLQSTGQGESPHSWMDRYMSTSEVVSALQKHCPNLEELAMPIRRSRGDRTEVETYRALGSLPKLHTLQLTLNCSDYSVLWAFEDPEDDGEGDWPEPPTESHFDDFDRQFYPQKYQGELFIRNGYIRDAIINCAVDETLARAIFRCISSGKAAKDRLLEHLEIRVRGGATFSASMREPLASVRHIVQVISRDWELKRNVRDDRRGEILVGDITPVKPRATKPRPNEEHYGSIEAGEEIARNLWPEWGLEGNFWKSFPLEMDG